MLQLLPRSQSHPFFLLLLKHRRPVPLSRSILLSRKRVSSSVRWNSTGNGGRAPVPPAPRVYPSLNQTTTANNTASSLYSRTKNRGPVSWTSLFLVTVAAASAVTYYQIERERRLERAMGKIVSSEYNGTAPAAIVSSPSSSTTTTTTNPSFDTPDGWTPRPGYLAKRKFVATRSGWFPVDDAFGPCEFLFLLMIAQCSW
jgi:hypothetical protein